MHDESVDHKWLAGLPANRRNGADGQADVFPDSVCLLRNDSQTALRVVPVGLARQDQIGFEAGNQKQAQNDDGKDGGLHHTWRCLTAADATQRKSETDGYSRDEFELRVRVDSLAGLLEEVTE